MDTEITIQGGPDAPPVDQALRELVKQCREIARMAPNRQAELAQLIDQFHVTLIDADGPLWPIRRGVNDAAIR